MTLCRVFGWYRLQINWGNNQEEISMTKLKSKQQTKTTNQKTPKLAQPKKQITSKKQNIISLLKRKSGVSLAELCDKTGWQPHSIRGFLSGTLHKKMQCNLKSTINKKGTRIYHLISSPEPDLATTNAKGK